MISFNIASIPDRVDLLINTVHSIIDQVDVVNLCLNNYEHNPFENNKKVNVVFSNNSLGDGGKFLFVNDFNGYYFTGDDDLIYPPTYIKDTIKQLERGFKIVTYHGRTFLHFPVNSYYKSPAIRNRCLGDWDFTEPVHIGGTGVMAFHTKDFKPNISAFKRSNMSDIWIGCQAREQNIKIWGLKHNSTYLTYQRPSTTIYDDKVNDCEYETEIVNKYFCK